MKLTDKVKEFINRFGFDDIEVSASVDPNHYTVTALEGDREFDVGTFPESQLVEGVRRQLVEIRSGDLAEMEWPVLEPEPGPGVLATQSALAGFGVPAWVSERLQEVGYTTTREQERIARSGAEKVLGPKIARYLELAIKKGDTEEEYVFVQGCPMPMVRRGNRLNAPWGWNIILRKGGLVNPPYRSIDINKWAGWKRTLTLVTKEVA